LAGDALAGTALMAFGLQSSPMIGEAMLKVSTSTWIAGTSAYQAATIAEANIVYGGPGKILPVNTYSNKASEIIDADYEAQANGQPLVLTRGSSSNINPNRTSALSGTSTLPNLSRHEYPMACTMEGGKGATVSYVTPAQNSIHGNELKRFMETYNVGVGDNYIHNVGYSNWTNVTSMLNTYLQSLVVSSAYSKNNLLSR
jgi:hypothetical protein